jgi:hypothetical protein
MHSVLRVVGATALGGSVLALAACFELRSDTTPPGGDGGGADSGGEATPGDAAGACQPPGTGCDFYVDHSADAGACAFATIGAAVAAAQTSSCPSSRTVHVAPGTYSTDTGEAFPIEVRGVSIVGAGPDVTRVSGAGTGTHVSVPSSAFGPLSGGGAVTATFLVGDSAAQTSIANLAIDRPPPVGVVAQTFEAIVCDRGNASAAPPAPNTTINHVTVENADLAVRVTWARPPVPLSGCNALIINSTLRDGSYGVIADGYGTDTAPVQLVSLQLGDSAGHGNQLFNFDFTTTGVVLGGAGLVIADGVTGAVVRGNTFAQEPGARDDFGIWIVQRDYDPIGTDIEDNVVGPLLNEGIALFGKVAVKSLLRNKVEGVSMQNEPQYGWLGIGLSLGLEGYPDVPFVALARDNTFIGNDVAVDFRSTTDALPTDPNRQSDFGTATSPGGNTFQCNSGWATDNAGGDVYVQMRVDVPAPAVIPFEGNIWDHKPPTTAFAADTAPTTPRGIDVLEYGVPSGADGGGPPQLLGGAIDTTNAKTASIPCPPNHVAGP